MDQRHNSQSEFSRLWIEDQIQAGDEIVISVAEHHANFIPWQQLAERKQAKLIVLPLDKSYQIDQQVLTQVLSVKTKIVAFNLVSNVTGVRQPAEQIVSIIRERSSAQIVVDMAQAVCSEQVDVQKSEQISMHFQLIKCMGQMALAF